MYASGERHVGWFFSVALIIFFCWFLLLWGEKFLALFCAINKYKLMNKTPDINPETFGRGRRKKWDVDEIERLYMGGAEISDILKQPKFENMSKFYLKNLMVKGKWVDKRKALRAQVSAIAAPKLEEVMAKETEAHYHFMLQQIAEERQQIVARAKGGNIKDQAARLDVLAEYEKIASRALGLDEQNVHDKKGLSVNAMISLHMTGPQKAEQIQIVSSECISSDLSAGKYEDKVTQEESGEGSD
jgi:hypothetical protein